MVSNPFKEQQSCFKWLQTFFKNMASTGIQQDTLLIDALIIFAVSENAVKKQIRRYINTDYLIEEHGYLKRKKG